MWKLKKVDLNVVQCITEGVKGMSRTVGKERLDLSLNAIHMCENITLKSINTYN
jgi:hypothetical protein